MVSEYKVQSAEIKQTKAGKPYLLLKINDKLVSFFDEPDSKVPVKEGQIISCEITQKGNFLNGSKLIIVEESKAKKIEQEIKVDGEAKENENTLNAGGITYYFDIKTAKNNAKYLTISQSSAQGKSQILIFEDRITEFLEKLKKQAEKLKKPN